MALYEFTTKQILKALEVTEQIDVLNERVPVNEMKMGVDNFAY